MKKETFLLRQIVVFCMLIILHCIPLMSQAPYLEIEKCFGGNSWDIPYALKITQDTNFIVYGASQSIDGDVHGIHGDRDLWILKITPEFDTIWTSSFGGTEREWAGDVIETTDNGFLLSAETYSSDGDVHGNYGESDAWLLKLNTNGDTMWTKRYGGSGEDAAQMILPLGDSGYLVCGGTSSMDGVVHGNHGSYDFWLLRLDLNGDTLWSRCYGGSENDFARTIDQTEEGDYVVAGYATSNDGDVHGNHGGSDYFVIKIDPLGDTIWTHCYGGSGSEGVHQIKSISGGGFILTGYTLSNDGDIGNHNGDYDAWIVKLNDSGEIEWEKCLGGSDSDYTTELICMDDGSYIAAGYAASVDGYVKGNHGERDAWLISLDGEGDTLWTHCYGGSNTDEIQAIVKTENGFVFTGYSNSEDGDVLSERFAGHDYWMVKLLFPEKPASLNKQILPLPIFPNPTNGMLFIDSKEIEEMFIFSSTGRLIARTSKKEYDLSNYSPGIYLVQLVGNNGQMTSERIVLIE